MFFLTEPFYLFLPLLFAVYWLSPERARNWTLLLGSVVWLMLFSLQTLIALALITLGLVYPVARLVQRRRDEGEPRIAWIFAWGGIVALILVASLLRLKSYFFPGVTVSLSAISNNLLQWIGFSYFLLKGIHVLLSTASGILRLPGPAALLQYMLFLPTVTSGPIYRLDTFNEQLEAPKHIGWDDAQDGLLRILRGLGKKVVGVYFLNGIYLTLHAHGHAWLPLSMIALYVLLFLDFSGYCDIAIGCGRLLGFQVPENFKEPFRATTLTQFWRNWHATLGDWLREHVFIPLGGMRAKGARLAVIVLVTMLVVGIWHSYSLVFVAWGLYHGLLLLLEERLGVKPLRRHRTPRWRLGLRYALVQAAAIGGMFAFVGQTGP
jgi:D-alanyl-lipoteichoic acid acyltransferase DltB (MBOAT superfamily)